MSRKTCDKSFICIIFLSTAILYRLIWDAIDTSARQACARTQLFGFRDALACSPHRDRPKDA
ncbi:unnamed protein product [Onchocerca flexuosa]|uniref:Secreted protein n=1 Tax=Onchocerca flexuosa TaxID=387005 RepID=A0A183I3Q7_9BILA|nr:unnamed protein product [Onchocerca flexuosa]